MDPQSIFKAFLIAIGIILFIILVCRFLRNFRKFSDVNDSHYMKESRRQAKLNILLPLFIVFSVSLQAQINNSGLRTMLRGATTTYDSAQVFLEFAASHDLVDMDSDENYVKEYKQKLKDDENLVTWIIMRHENNQGYITFKISIGKKTRGNYSIKPAAQFMIDTKMKKLVYAAGSDKDVSITVFFNTATGWLAYIKKHRSR